jgi:hypothetical protein
MEAAGSSQTWVTVYQTTCYPNLESHNINHTTTKTSNLVCTVVIYEELESLVIDVPLAVHTYGTFLLMYSAYSNLGTFPTFIVTMHQN